MAKSSWFYNIWAFIICLKVGGTPQKLNKILSMSKIHYESIYEIENIN